MSIRRPDKTNLATQERLLTWYDKLSTPVIGSLRSSVQRLIAVLNDENSSALQVSHAALQDPGLITQLLKAANNPLHNSSGVTISSLSRAVVVLGYETINTLTVNVPIIEDIVLNKRNRHYLYRQLALNYHTAVLAESLAEAMHDRTPSEIFLAGTLMRIGHIFLHCNAQDTALELEDIYQHEAMTVVQAERHMLGFPISELSRLLVSKMPIGRLLAPAFRVDGPGTTRWKGVQFCHEISTLIAKHKNWNNAAVNTVIDKISCYSHMDNTQTKYFLMDAAKHGREKLLQYSIDSKLTAFYPSPDAKMI